MLITFSYRASVFYLISTLSGLECLEHFYLCLFWEASFWLEWKCVAHWLLPSIRARQYSSGVHSKPLNTAFCCSCPEVSKPQGLCCLTPSNSLFFHFSLEMWKKKKSSTSVQFRIQTHLRGALFTLKMSQHVHLLTNTFLYIQHATSIYVCFVVYYSSSFKKSLESFWAFWCG